MMRGVVVVFVVLLCVGCLPRIHEHEAEASVAVPALWLAAAGNDAEATAWVEDLGDATLAALIREAWRHNQDLHQAEARWRRAAAIAEQAGAPRLPTLDVAASAGRGRSVVETGFGLTARTANQYQIEARLGWEIDVWGRLGQTARAALVEAEAVGGDLTAARLSLAAAVAEHWYRLAHDRLQRDLAIAYRDNVATTVALVERRWGQGEARLSDLHLIRAEQAQAVADLERRERLFAASSRALAVLLGRYPAAELAGAEDLPPPPATLATGLPADLLWRRPDLRSGASRLQAGNHRLRAARADLLPRLSLTAAGGVRSGELRNLSDPDYLFWNLLGNLLAPVFDGGRRRAVVRERQAEADAALAAWRSLVLQAFAEVEQALSAEELLRRELAARAQALDDRQAAVQVMRQVYDDGQGDALELLQAARSAVLTEQGLLALRFDLLRNRLALYKALGGPALVLEEETP